MERTEDGPSPGRYPAAARLLGAAFGLAIPSLLRGQLVSDEVPRDRTVTAQEQLDEDLKDSRFHLGPMRLLPGFEVNNAGYNSNVFGSQFNPVGDWTATLGLGTKVIIPFSSKIYFVGDAFPTYTWYANFSNLDTWGGHAKASIAGYFNRLSFEFGGNGFQGIAAPTPEQPQPTLEKTADAFAHVEVDLTHKLGLFLGGEAERVRQTQEGPVSPGDVNVALQRPHGPGVRRGPAAGARVLGHRSGSAVHELPVRPDAGGAQQHQHGLSARGQLQPAEVLSEPRRRVPGRRIVPGIVLPELRDARRVLLRLVFPEALARDPELRGSPDFLQYLRRQPLLFSRIRSGAA